MTTLIFWSFVLALIPLVLDLIGRTAAVLGVWIALHHTQIPAAASNTHIDLRWNGETYCRLDRESHH